MIKDKNMFNNLNVESIESELKMLISIYENLPIDLKKESYIKNKILDLKSILDFKYFMKNI